MANDGKKKYSHLKMTSGGKAENENVQNPVYFDIFNFSSATRGHFSNVNTLLLSMAT